nr:hypothetical protein BaRGS_002923 [Batillaria attramentaria]
MFTVCRHGAVQGDGAETACCENLFDFNFIRCPVCRENCYISGGIGSLPRENLALNLEKMVNSQLKVVSSLQCQRRNMKEMEESYKRRQEEINMQCDSLLAEVENKRSLFLADLDQEERMRRSEMEEVVDVYEKVLSASQSLGRHATTLLETGTTPSILQISPALTERLINSHVDCEACGAVRDDLELDMNTVTATCSGRIVDLRRQQAMLRDIHYLNPPDPPAIDVTRCARSVDTVALFLAPPRGTSDVIDTYHIHYCSEEQKALGIEETVTCRSGHNEHLTCLSPTAASLSHVALLENLHRATTHYFYAAASNRAGHSGNSEVVQCVTLSPRDSVVPVPVIMESMCKAYTTSIRVFTPSPHDVAPEQSISHYLLYRPRDRKSLWRAVALCGRQEHRVFGLEADTQYEFVVMASNPRGECQLSQKLLLRTEHGGS